MKYDVFISYRRDGGEYTAKMIYDKLSEQGYRVFLDMESMHAGAFNKQLYSVIDQCKDFVLVLSPGALDRCIHEEDWVRKEIEHAILSKKNIVPILIRGFQFPSVLPASIGPLIYENGIESNTQFFEAFIQKVTKFLKSKPPLFNRLKKKANLIYQIAALLLCVLIAYGVWSWCTSYPRTQKEKQTTEEVVSYISDYLRKAEEMAGAYDEALLAIERYLCTNETDSEYLKKITQKSKLALKNQNISEIMPTDEFIEGLESSRFEADSFNVLYALLEQLGQQWLDNVVLLEGMCENDWHDSKDQTMEIIVWHREMLNNYLVLIASTTNEILLPITHTEPLETLLYAVIPELNYIPLVSEEWRFSPELLQKQKTVARDNLMGIVEKALGNSERSLETVDPKILQQIIFMSETNIDWEMMNFVSQQLRQFDFIAESYLLALDSARQYISAGLTDNSAVESHFAASRQQIKAADVEKVAPNAVFIKSISNSPFDVAEVQAMHETLVMFQQECLDNLDYLEQMLSPDYYPREAARKLEILEQYEKMLQEELKIFGYGGNQILLPITKEEALDEFWYERLPYFTNIPLRANSWSQDYDKLESAIESALQTIEVCINNLSTIVSGASLELEQTEADILQSLVDRGYTRVTAEKIWAYQREDPEIRRQKLIQAHLDQGYSQGDAENLATTQERMLEAQAKMRISTAARVTDDIETLWEKMTYLLSVDLYEEALECGVLYQQQMTNSDNYLPGIQLFIRLMQQTDLDYGIMVMEYYEPDGINEVLEIGDIIYGFDGKACHNSDEYIAMKEALTSNSYVVDVLRMDGATGEWEMLQLTLTKDMPRVYFNDLVANTN